MLTNERYVLVVGGAGYIGSHMVLTLQKAGFTPIVLDNLSRGKNNIVPNTPLIVGDMANKALLEALFTQYPFLAVLHFAALIEVAESIQFPEKYYQNNVAATCQLLEMMLKHKIKNFIFSSSAAIYGEPCYLPIDEKHPCQPLNPYGKSKWMVEEIIQDYAKANRLYYVILRYFNAAGAAPMTGLSEYHDPESHLIPLALQVALGLKKELIIYGQDYPTLDGTCMRDYVHVVDLCEAHLQALQGLLKGSVNKIYNLGTGQGYTVQQVVDVVTSITRQKISIIQGARRFGDCAALVADASLAKRELKWQPQYTDLKTMVSHAWQAIMEKE